MCNERPALSPAGCKCRAATLSHTLATRSAGTHARAHPEMPAPRRARTPHPGTPAPGRVYAMAELTETRESAMAAETGRHARTSEFVLKRFERWALPRLAARLPRWVVPDHLTALGLLASTAVGVAYALSNRSEYWLWLANVALVVNWFGDSLDGTLARYRRIESPRYGYYLDHLTDAYSTLAIGIGLGFSPYMLLAVGLAIVIAYLLLSINVYL